MTAMQLSHIMALLLARKIEATQIIVKGKDTEKVSFTAPRIQYSKINKLCCDWNWGFTTTADKFISRLNDRYQIDIGGEQ